MRTSPVLSSDQIGAGRPAPSKKEASTIEEKAKRKTHTSSAVKSRYNAKAYRQFAARVKPDLSQRIEDYTAREGISKPEFLRRAIDILEAPSL